MTTDTKMLLITPEALSRLLREVANGDKVMAIKEYRSMARVGLVEAQHFIEAATARRKGAFD